MKGYSPRTFHSEKDKQAFVHACDRDMRTRITQTVNAIVGQETGVHTLGLCGPTCSGKTTAAKALLEAFSKAGKRVHTVSIDDFYYDKSYLHQRERHANDMPDYDSVHTIDLPALAGMCEGIGKSERLTVPVFDFVRGERVAMREIVCREGDVLLFEGIQVLYPEVRAIIAREGMCGIFIAPKSEVWVEDSRFEPNELRLLRRLVRDARFRNTSAEDTLRLWDNVRANEEASIFPYMNVCEYQIDATYDCELHLLAPHVRPLLVGVSEASGKKETAELLLSRLVGIEGITDAYLSADSLFHEFI
ncbi:MAG: hypothetical protein E7664_03895 [Ruminococcaceae bacterium]|nr:hypothetical protein [Oscillospiraceae bacterium]